MGREIARRGDHQGGSLGATTTAATQGLAFVNDSAAVEFFDVVRSQAVIGKVPFRRIPFRTPTLSMDEGPAVAWRDENAAYRDVLAQGEPDPPALSLSTSAR